MKNKIVLLSLLVVTLGRPVFAQTNEPSRAVEVSLANGPHGSHILTGEFSIAASSAAAWAVLTDYDHLPEFVSSIRSSRKTGDQMTGETVEQVMTGHVGIFIKRISVRLEIFEKPFELISFQDVSARSFTYYVGSWQIRDRGSGVTVLYRLEATPAFFSPNFVAAGAFKKSVMRLLEEVRDEIMRRNRSKDLRGGIR